ncbi:MAG: T9SS type A sorting domain-containing protein [Chitinophagaceae bacterium]|nr:T9SS type A sorting domain-containing protein [Chitinophagaceae bacterium]
MHITVLLFIISGSGFLNVHAQDSLLYHDKRSIISLFENGTVSGTDEIRAENSRSDTIDILDYHISLSITDFIGKTINGNCRVSFRSKIENCNFIDLDLLAMTIDSVKQDDQLLTFNYSNNLLLRINFLQPLNTDDSTAITVYYHGVPQVDITGWGGFYFTGDYAYNLGVGFGADPHTYGRVWFPCFDNFIERSTYEFSITTAGTKMALCNGELVSSTDNGDDTKTWNWKMTQTIPTYLACVAVGNYTPAYQEYAGIESVIPIQLGAIATDTVKMKNSFIHLPDALATFENAFGPYRWSKVGYSLVPFSSGAMEHATNIAYPVFMANGTLTWEAFLVHELSHHWFGDLVTCRTQEDMWLNEGWASYCERLFLEVVYGKEAYDVSIADNHAKVVHYAHTTAGDGEYLPVSGISHEHTYGTTVYDKGADMVHTLRGYMGDSLFFHCVTNFLDAFAFKDASSEDLRDFLTGCSGTDLYPFFNDWIFNRGFPHFSVDSFQVTPVGNMFNVNVFVKQRLNHAPHYYEQVPLEITFMDKLWNSHTEKVKMNGQCGFFSTQLPFNPDYAGIDLAEKISDATTSGMKTMYASGLYDFDNGAVTMNVSELPDSAFIRAEHNYAPPDPFKVLQQGLHISDYHYWKIDGIIPAGFEASAVLRYDGSNFSTGGFLDNTLITNVEDSLVVLYRISPVNDWEILTDVTQNFTGSHTDKRGYFSINHVEKGEYAFGIFDYDKPINIDTIPDEPCQFLTVPFLNAAAEAEISIYPNPAGESITVAFNKGTSFQLLEIYDLYGRKIYFEKLDIGSSTFLISAKHWPAGPYLVCLADSNGHSLISRLIIIN